MRTGFSDTARRLWLTARPWRYTVQAAGVFTVLAILNIFTGSPAPPPPAPSPSFSPPPLAPLDPAVEARLVAFDIAAAEADTRTNQADKCEHLVVAYSSLGKDDVAIGRNVVRSTAARIKAIGTAQACQAEVTASDARIAALDRTVTGLAPGSVGTWCVAVSTLSGRLTDFDRARSGRIADILPQAARISDSCAASDKRLLRLSEAVAAVTPDPDAKAFQRVADALRVLSEGDRARLLSTQKATLEKADQVAAAVGASRARIGTIPGLLAAVTAGQDRQAATRLLNAVNDLTSFDEELASSGEVAAIAEARVRATGLAWTLLKEILPTLPANASDTNYRTVAILYEVVRRDPGRQSADQAALLREAAEAVRVLTASDARLRQLTGTATAWQNQRFAVRDDVTAVVGSITAFDQQRFTPAQTTAWQTLSRAALIIHGPALGLSSASGRRTAIYVFTAADDVSDRRVVNTFGEAFRKAGYQVVATRNDASLLVKSAIRHVGQPQLSTAGGPVAQFRSDTEIDVDAWWASDDSRLLAAVIPGTGWGDYTAAQAGALQNAVESAVSRLQGQAGK